MSKKVLVTGVSRGIGRAIAERFLNEGYTLYGTFNTSEEKANELLSKYGSDRVVLFGFYDFTDLEQVKSLVEELKKNKYDSLICNSGIFSKNDDFYNLDIDEFQKIMNCNFYAPLMISIGLKENISRGGSIVIMSSNDAYPGAFGSMSYSISKSALISLMKCLCVNFGEYNIRVNSVAPGAINTDMNTLEQMELSPLYTPIGRVGQPDEIANVVFFLASDESSFVNGENITIDGGYNIVSIILKRETDNIRTRSTTS